MPITTIQDSMTQVATAGAGGVGFTGLLIWIFSKLRRSVSHDSGDTAAHSAMQATMIAMQGEVTRLHDQVMLLQKENARLQLLVAELSVKLISFSSEAALQAKLDDAAREGKIERRGRRKLIREMEVIDAGSD